MISNCSNLLAMRNLQEQVKKHSVSKIVLVISKFLQILGLQPRISKVFFRSLAQFFLTVGQNNFGYKIPFHIWCNNMTYWLSLYLSITWYKLHFLLSGFFMEDMGVWKKMAGKKIISAKCAIPKLRMSLDNCHSQIHFFSHRFFSST